MAEKFSLRKYYYDLINEERERQEQLHPMEKPYSDLEFFTILSEEVGEVAKALLENDNVEEEIIHVTAVCMRWLENRNTH